MENEGQTPEQEPIMPIMPILLPDDEPDKNRPKKGTLEADLRDLGRFLRTKGANILYCLSALSVAYGIVKVMGPILVAGDTLREGLACFFTLHGYEVALLLALIVIVRRKATDDAVSLLLIIALYLVGTAIAQGALADTDVRGSVYLGLLGIVLGAVKLGLLRKVVRIPLGAWSLAGLMVMVAVNYLEPAALGRFLTTAPSQEATRRTLWLWMWLALLAGAGLTVLASLRIKNVDHDKAGWSKSFLHTPLMAFVLVMIVLATSSVHQYSMSFTFTLERGLGDYAPALALVCLLLLEALWRAGKSSVAGDLVISCLPLGLILLAIHYKSVIDTGNFGIGLLVYPPAALAWMGLLLGWRNRYRRQKGTLVLMAVYGLGVVLTFGYSPERPYDLNYLACGGALVASLWVYGLLRRQPYACWTGVILLAAGLPFWPAFGEACKSQQVTLAGGMAGVLGLGTLIIYLIFTWWNKYLLYLGAVLLAVGVYDYLPVKFTSAYLIIIIAAVVIIGVLWLRAKNLWAGMIVLVALLAKSYLASKQLAYWRFVVLGFILLAAGTMISLFKPRNTVKDEESLSHDENINT
ncbi:MAG: hypothetical protein JW709_10365 [Sedimentisphaerales bacterium]|nr:hypothetical protein [Sedimentisphaerales bacterium]